MLHNICVDWGEEDISEEHSEEDDEHGEQDEEHGEQDEEHSEGLYVQEEREGL